MKRILSITALTLVVALSSTAAFARGGGGGGGGGSGRFSSNQQNTYGWQLMTSQERAEHQTKLRSFTDVASCEAYVMEHHQVMEEKAKAKGITLLVRRQDPCAMMKARGLLK